MAQERNEDEMRALRGDFIVDVPEDEKEQDDEELEDEEDKDDEDQDKTEDDDNEEEDSEDGEEEEGDEEDADDDDADDEAGEPKQSRKDNRVPKSRLDRVISQREEQKERAEYAEEQLAALIKQGKAPEEPEVPKLEPYDFNAKENKYMEAILSGDTNEAVRLRTEIDSRRASDLKTELMQSNQSVKDTAQEESRNVVVQDRLDNLILDMEEQYPFLDENSKSWNREATATVNALMTGYIADGKEMDHALALAIKKIVPMYTEESTTPIKKEGTRRTKKARQKAVDADKRQPPKSRNSRANKETSVEDVNVHSLSERQYKTLTAKEKAILRGDVIA